MTASPVSTSSRPRAALRPIAALMLACGLLLAAAPDASAQVGGEGGGGEGEGGGQESRGQQGGAGPIPLFPPTVRPGTPGEAAPAAPAGDLPRWPGDSDIEVNRLGQPDTESLGILDREHGGLGADAWAGSARPRIEALLRDLPGDLASPTLRRLTGRLLLSSAPPPAGAPAASGAPTMADAVAAAQESDFLRLRAQGLYALGELDGLNRLLGLVPQWVEDPWIAEARVDGLLLAGRDQDACSQVLAGLARFPQSLYWAKAQVFCQFVAERTDQALLGLDLLREQAPDSDPGFFRVANGFIGGAPEALPVDALTPLNLAMLRNSGGSPAPGAVRAVDPLLLHGIAQLDGDPAVQAAAVERLVEIGALPGDRLAAAYGAFEFTDAELGDALAEAERAAQSAGGGAAGGEGAGVRSRALLFRAADRETMAATRAEILRAAFLSAEADGRSTALARAVVPLMTELAPTPQLAWFAPLAARTLYRAGQFERAGAWLSVLRQDGERNPESHATYQALRPLVRLAGGQEPLAGDGLTGDQRLLLFVLSRALGQNEDLGWVEAGKDPTAAPLERLARLLALGDAAVAGRRGETVLLAVVGLGAEAPGTSHPLALGYAVSGLSAVGLGADARALAIEAALAAGI